jgi:predicted transcriptional regulator
MAEENQGGNMKSKAAERRAKITAYLKQLGISAAPDQIAEGTSIPASTVETLCREMARNGLIEAARDGSRMVYASNGGNEDPEAAPTIASVKRKYSKRAAAAAPADDVELVVGGSLIVVGRNPATGRIRITIEEAA